MHKLPMTIHRNITSKKIMLELDVDKLERLTANLDFFGDDFLKSVERAEKDEKAGKFHKLNSLRDLR